jgi:hypothetical protein
MNKHKTKIIETEKTNEEQLKLHNLIYRLGYWSGRLDELALNIPFVSLRWWITFLVGISWGIMIAMWVI